MELSDGDSHFGLYGGKEWYGFNIVRNACRLVLTPCISYKGE